MAAPVPGGIGTPVGWGSSRPPKRPRGRRGLVAAAVAVVLAGAGTAVLVGTDAGRSGASPAAPTAAQAADAKQAELAKQRAVAINRLLDTMNSALKADDERAYVSVVLPGSAAFLAHQKAVFRGLQRVPFTQVRYEWFRQTYLTVPDLADQYAGPAFTARVLRHYTLGSWDEQPVTELQGLTFSQSSTDGRWYLAADDDAENQLPHSSYAEPWQIGDVSVASTSRVLVVGDAAAVAGTRKLATRLDALVGKVAALWGGPHWNGRVVVYAVTDKRFVNAWFGTQAATGRRTESTDPATFDAVVGDVYADPSDADPGSEPAGTRMVLTPALVRSKDTQYVEQVLKHELTHVVTNRISTGEMPIWMVEGIAEYTAARSSGGTVDGVTALDRRGLTTSQWRRLRQNKYRMVLPIAHEVFYQGNSDQVGDSYASAWFACLYIADHYGEKRLKALYRRTAELAGTGTAAQAEADALREVLKIDHARLVKDATSYARTLRKRFV
jgi:hypothetical protein